MRLAYLLHKKNHHAWQPKSAKSEIMPLVGENPDTPGSAGWFANEELKESQRDADMERYDKKMREMADKNKILEKRVEHLKGDLYLCAGAIETLEAKEREWARKLLAHEQGVETGNTTYLVFTNEEIANLRKEAE